jgi:ribosomal protein S18 acetylase RimI-like enzyme
VIIRFTDIQDTPQTHASRRTDVMMLNVVPEFRRQGIGRKLMKCVLDQANELKATFITLCVAEHNQAAVALYERMGWVSIDRMMAFPLNVDTKV